MHAVLAWLRSIGCCVLLNGDGTYTVESGSVVDVSMRAIEVVRWANNLRLSYNLEPFSEDLAASHYFRRKGHTGSLHLIVGS